MSGEQTPTWRYVVPGLLFLALAAYMLINGEIAADKARTLYITRSGNPLVYWTTVLASGTIGILALRKAWQRMTGA